MATVNFCPSCATSRAGRFCTGCGMNLEAVESALTGQMANDPGASERLLTPEESASLAPDSENPSPSDAAEGTSTSSDSGPLQSGDVSPPGLVYPVEFDEGLHCHNCGNIVESGPCSLCEH